MNGLLPLVSVVIPAFNMSAYISDAIDSVVDQSYNNIEIVVVDDGSADETVNIVKKYVEQAGIKLICQANKGPSAARNMGIRACNGQYIAFLDADDYWDSTKVEKQVDVLQNRSDIDVVYCLFQSVQNGEVLPGTWNPPKPRNSLFEELIYSNVIAGSCSAVMLRAESLKETGLFDEDLFISEDQDLWRRLAFGHNFFCIQEPLTFIRIHPQSAQVNLRRVEKGNLVYLEKLKASLPKVYQFHWKEVAFNIYEYFSGVFFRNKEYLKAVEYSLRCISLGFPFFIRITAYCFRFFISRLTSHA